MNDDPNLTAMATLRTELLAVSGRLEAGQTQLRGDFTGELTGFESIL